MSNFKNTALTFAIAAAALSFNPSPTRAEPTTPGTLPAIAAGSAAPALANTDPQSPPQPEELACLFCCNNSCNGGGSLVQLDPTAPKLNIFAYNSDGLQAPSPTVPIPEVPEVLAGYGWGGFQGRIRFG